MKIEDLNIGSYEFTALVNFKGELLPVDGTFSIEWNINTPVVVLEDLFDSEANVSMLHEEDLRLALEQKIELEGPSYKWANDYEALLEDVNWSK